MSSNVANITNSALEASTPREARWDLAFIGILFYLIIDYTRLPAMYPVLQTFQIAKIAVALAAMGLVLSVRPQYARPPRTQHIEVALVAYAFGATFAACFAQSAALAWLQVADIARWVAVALLFGRIVNSRWRFRVVLLVYVLLNLKLAQFQLRTYGAGLDMGVSEESLARGVGAGSTGFFANSNDFGLAMCVAVPLAATLVVADPSKLRRALAAVAFLVIFLALFMSASRGAMVGVVCAAVLLWVRNLKRLIVPVLAATLLMGVWFVLPQAHRDRVRSAFDYKHDGNAQIRLTLWAAGWQIFTNHPILGVGPDNFGYIVRRDPVYRAKRWVAAFHPHSIYLQPLSETGLLGSAPLFASWVFVFLLNRESAIRTRGKPSLRFEHYVASGLNVALISFLISGAFLTVLLYPHIWFLVGISMGLHRWLQQIPLTNSSSTAGAPASPIASLVPMAAEA